MKFAQADFRKIQISALACIVLIVAGAGGVYFAHTVAKAARADRTLAQNQRFSTASAPKASSGKNNAWNGSNC